jgi:hypothetical protein
MTDFESTSSVCDCISQSVTMYVPGFHANQKGQQ